MDAVSKKKMDDVDTQPGIEFEDEHALAADADAQAEIEKKIERDFVAELRAEEEARAEKEKKEREAFFTLLASLMTAPQAEAEKIVRQDSRASRAFDALSKNFPAYKTQDNKGVFSGAQGSIVVEASRISYVAAATPGTPEAIKSFGVNEASAMVTAAFLHPGRQGKSIRLRGTPEQQKLLQDAIDEVNKSLAPEQRLIIKNRVDAPAAENAVVADAAGNDNASEAAHKPKKEGGVSRRGMLSLLGGAIVGGALLNPESVGEADAARSKYHDLVKAKSGLYPELEEKLGLKSSRPKSKTREKPKSKKETRQERKARLKREVAQKKETPAQRKARERAEARAKISKQKQADAARAKLEKKLERDRLAAEKAKQRKENKEWEREATGVESKTKKAREKLKPRESFMAAAAVASGKGGVYLYNRHTAERYYFDFSKIGTASCSAKFNRFARDHYSGAVAKMDTRLLRYIYNIVSDLRKQGHGVNQVDFISGYRTVKTNKVILKNKTGSNSQHCLAKALDIAINGVSTKKLHSSACRVGCDGVGYYPQSGFVHVDCRGHTARW